MNALGTPLRVILDGDGAFEGMKLRQAEMGSVDAVVALANGTTGGKPSVCFKVTVDGVEYLAETTWALLNMAHVAIAALYGVPQ